MTPNPTPLTPEEIAAIEAYCSRAKWQPGKYGWLVEQTLTDLPRALATIRALKEELDNTTIHAAIQVTDLKLERDALKVKLNAELDHPYCENCKR